MSSAKLKFYLTPEHPCSYFRERRATTLFVDPRIPVSGYQFALLTENGFRRSGDYIYRPQCETCQACESLRIPIAQFQANKSQRRVAKRNEDLTVYIKPVEFRQEHYQLYEKYIDARHKGGDMYPASEQQYQSFLLTPFPTARLLEFRLEQQLVAVAMIDELPEALSAIYTFFDPDLSERSLGTYAILWQIAQCRVQELRFLYLGYYIQASQKMSYKSHFRPFELYRNNQWHLQDK